MRNSLCCRRFCLPKDPYIIGKINKEDVEDIDIIKDMLIYLGKYKEDAKGNPKEKYHHHYTCRHLNEETGECSIYENRPKLCRNYPVKECDYKEECGTYSYCNGCKNK